MNVDFHMKLLSGIICQYLVLYGHHLVALSESDAVSLRQRHQTLDHLVLPDAMADSGVMTGTYVIIHYTISVKHTYTVTDNK